MNIKILFKSLVFSISCLLLFGSLNGNSLGLLPKEDAIGFLSQEHDIDEDDLGLSVLLDAVENWDLAVVWSLLSAGVPADSANLLPMIKAAEGGYIFEK